MFITETQIRIHYALTDQMGVVYYGNYAQFYEIGRTESIRTLGLTYKEIEANGILLAVTDMHIRFLRPAKYDDLITVKTSIRELPVNHKIIFHTEIFNEENILLNAGNVTLFSLRADTMKRVEIPSILKDKLLPWFK